VGTAKRERQKANRQIRLHEMAKEARKQKSKRMALRVGMLVALVVAIVGIVYAVSGNSDSSTASGATTTAAPDTIAPTTTFAKMTKPTVTKPATTPTTLVTTVINQGSGAGAKAGDTITVYYVGAFSKDGKEFENNYESGQSISFPLGQGGVIKGWDQGLIGAKVGERLQLDIPSALAYGAAGKGSIGPNEPLSFVVDVLDITPVAGADTGGTTVTPTT
jgi:peptidylprolyl isomerase